jgi:hypothetical protein
MVAAGHQDFADSKSIGRVGRLIDQTRITDFRVVLIAGADGEIAAFESVSCS